MVSVTNVRLPLAISGPALRLARKAGFSRYKRANTVPKLNVATDSTGVRTAWFICPDFTPPSGGIRKLYRSVDILNDAGLHAAIVHKRPGFSCAWFDHRTRVVNCSQVLVRHHDVIVVPEIYGASILDLPSGVRQIIFNQNVYNTVSSLNSGGPAVAPYMNNPDLTAVLTVSEDNTAVIKYAFPGVHVRCVRHWIDSTLYHPPGCPKKRRIAYMPRRRAREAAEVLELLRLRGVLNNWEVVAIDGRKEAEVADLLRAAQIFLSFSHLEGLGLPPLEALACGCLVVGYHGFGGREFFQPPFATSVEDGNVVAFAQAVEDIINLIDANSTNMARAATAGARFVHNCFSRDGERQDLLSVFVPLLDPTA